MRSGWPLASGAGEKKGCGGDLLPLASFHCPPGRRYLGDVLGVKQRHPDPRRGLPELPASTHLPKQAQLEKRQPPHLPPIHPGSRVLESY